MAEVQWECFKQQWETGFLSVSLAGPRDIPCTCQLKTIYIFFPLTLKFTTWKTNVVVNGSSRERDESRQGYGWVEERTLFREMPDVEVFGVIHINHRIQIHTCLHFSRYRFFKCSARVYIFSRWFVAQDLFIFTCSFFNSFFFWDIIQFSASFFFTWLLYFYLLNFYTHESFFFFSLYDLLHDSYTFTYL